MYNLISADLCDSAGTTGSVASEIWSAIDPDKNLDYMKSVKRIPLDRLRGKHNSIDTMDKLAQSKSRSLYTGAKGRLARPHPWRLYG